MLLDPIYHAPMKKDPWTSDWLMVEKSHYPDPESALVAAEAMIGEVVAAAEQERGQGAGDLILDFSNFGLTSLPPSLIALGDRLVGLHLGNGVIVQNGGNLIQELPDNFSKLSQLKYLNLNKIGLTVLPTDFSKLVHLRSLDLGWNRLELLPNDFCRLVQLQMLEISGNQLTALPDDFPKLVKLKNLSLCFNNFTAIPNISSGNVPLELLNLSGIPLTTLPAWVTKLINLRFLGLHGCELTSLPNDFSRLSRLEVLQVAANQLSALPKEFSNLDRLRVLDLSVNQLTELPMGFSKLSQLRQLFLAGNPLDSNLLAAAEEGIPALFRYLDAEKTDLPEGKLLLIGPPEVGKSSLMAALRDEPNYEGKRPQTHPLDRKDVRLGAARFNAWDFGGQLHYRATQQLFYSRGVYLAMWDPRHRDRTWRDLVQQLELVTAQVPTSDAKVFIVASHKDDCEAGSLDPAEEAAIRALLKDALPEDERVAFHHVNTIGDRKGIEELKACLIQETVDSGFVTLKIEKHWAALFQEVTGTKDTPGWPELYLTWEEYVDRVQKHEGLTEEDARNFATRMYHMGRWAYYKEGGALGKLVVLRPDWVTRAAAEILNAEVTKKEYGVIRYDDFCQIVAADSMDGKAPYPAETHDPLLQMLIQAGFCWIDRDAQKEWATPSPETRITFPQLLQEDPPEALRQGWAMGNLWTVGYQFLDMGGSPLDLVGELGLNWRLTTRLREMDLEDSVPRPDADRFHAWRYGVYRNLGEGREVKATFDPEVRGGPRTQLTLTYRGGIPTEWEPFVRQVLIELKNKLAREASIRRFVSCAPACSGKGACFGTKFFNLKAIQANAESNANVYCDQCDSVIESRPLIKRQPPDLDDRTKVFIERIKLEHFEYKEYARAVIHQLHKNLQLADLRIESRLDGIVKMLDASDRKIADLSKQAKATYDKLNSHLPVLAEQIEALARFLNDAGNDGPRLVKLRRMPWRFPGNLMIATMEYQVVLFCEHHRMAVPTLEAILPTGNVRNRLPGCYQLHLTREWVRTARPYLTILTRIAHTVVTGAANFDPDLQQGAIQNTELGTILATINDPGQGVDLNTIAREKIMEATGPKLRMLHAFLEDSGARGDGFGGLHKVRIIKSGSERGRVRWVHWSALNFVDPKTGERWYERW